MDYDPLLKLPTGTDDIEYLFKTQRGSTYAHHGDVTTTRNRSGANHRDATTGVQRRSGRTVYVTPEDMQKLAMFQNPDMATTFQPVMNNGKPTGRAALLLAENYGPRKAGQTLAEVPYKTKPEVGFNPVEIYNSESPIGDPGRGIHFGNQITEVHPRPARLTPAKAGLASLLVGGTGAAKAAMQGDFTPARELIGETLTPMTATPTEVNRGEQEWIDRHGSAAQQRYQQEAEQVLQKLQGYNKGGGVAMPKSYSAGSWKLI